MSKQLTLFYWYDENEGGYSICRTDEFVAHKNFEMDTGRSKVGEFDTVEELGELIYNEYGGELTKPSCDEEAKMLLYWYKEDCEDE